MVMKVQQGRPHLCARHDLGEGDALVAQVGPHLARIQRHLGPQQRVVATFHLPLFLFPGRKKIIIFAINILPKFRSWFGS